MPTHVREDRKRAEAASVQGRVGQSMEKAVSETSSGAKREYRTEHHTSGVGRKGRETKNL